MFSSSPPVDLGADTDLLGELLKVWKDRQRMNIRRSVYHDGEQSLKDFGISLPPQMRGIRSALGWVGKGVRALTDRSQFEGFVSVNGADDPLGVDEIIWDNQFMTELPAATVSSAMHGCSFITVTNGDLEAGEPDVLMLARSAESSAAIYDARTRALRAFLSVVKVGDGKEGRTKDPTEMVFYTPEFVYIIERRPIGWKTTRIEHGMGETPAYQLVHDYELRRPLGRSRISRASMYFADAALRTIVRSEVSAEFYSAPEYWLFGSNVKNFIGNDRWSAVMGRIKAQDVDVAADEKMPELHRFTGASPQPHADQLRMFASQFADEMDLDVRYADSSNPSSAEAIFAAKESLISSTGKANRLWGFGAVRAMNAAIRLRDDLDEDTDEMRTLRARFTDPVLVSPTSRADAFSKFAANIPGFAESEVGLEYGGLTREQITRFQAEQRRNRNGDLTSRLRELAGAAAPEPADGALQEAQIAKARAEALGGYRRAGVEEQNAAKLAGLTDPIEFIPGSPVTIRATE